MLGNESFEESKLRRQMKGTKEMNINFFKASKYISDKYEEDKDKLTTFYNDNGFRDFTIVSDSIVQYIRRPHWPEDHYWMKATNIT